ncbi:hypothetical protein [Rhodanobacter thiooxydans]|uniref:hypothetical protein n=1 Tax=Rhodanobacter thiooxydans TaxID=416169 RepID=UPI001F310549|nr:hypothetical protein [Rhodanobacter thiooxydans]UJJ56691.1 hypothetical protein LRK53_18960 [Rhodanobacter thiooxydans]
MSRRVQNRFRDPMLRKQFDALIDAYRRGHPSLLGPDGTKQRGNAAAQAFWSGFDSGDVCRLYPTPASRRTIAYACFRAGQEATWLPRPVCLPG